jgi:hypothetical protein
VININFVSTSDAAAVWTAWGTWVIAIGGVGALIFAGRAFRAQRRELTTLSQDSKLRRTPVLSAELDGTGSGQVADFRLDLTLQSPEQLESVRVFITEARADDCPVGFIPDQHGVEQHPDKKRLPPGWPNDVLRREATWDEWIVPGASTTWRLKSREQVRSAETSKIKLRAECQSASGESWAIHVPLKVMPGAENAIRLAASAER